MNQKLLFSSLVAGCLTFSINAQIFQEDFSNPITWRTFDADGDTKKWDVVTSSYFPSNEEMATSASFDFSTNTSLTPDNYLFSPKINLADATGTLTFAFEAGSAQTTGSNHYEEFLSVYIVTDTTLSYLNTAVPIHSEALSEGSILIPYNYDISSMAGQSEIYIVFRHHNCTFEGRLYMDNVRIVSSNENNLETLTIQCGNNHTVTEATLLDYTNEITAESTCQGNISINQIPYSGTTLVQGENTITFYVSDECGNIDSCSIIVNYSTEENKVIENELIEDFLQLVENVENNKISLQSPEKIKTIKIFNSRGEIIYLQDIDANSYSTSIENLNRGIYFVEATFISGKKAKKSFLKL